MIHDGAGIGGRGAADHGDRRIAAHDAAGNGRWMIHDAAGIGGSRITTLRVG
jgi:hypothetical protein